MRGIRLSLRVAARNLSLTCRALAAGELDIIAGNATDGLIAALDLVALEDDRQYFPPCQAVYVARQATLAAAPPLAGAIRSLDNAIDTAARRRMSAAADQEKRSPREIAADFRAARSRKPSAQP
ncbi:MAG: hypothetical protein CFK52_14645 [Chloracidobacterium sp. CP2_5A]|nr:MAG: hypothetical protein CFK52_14645 [Chloracidobacterium sp. CP2_5A]